MDSIDKILSRLADVYTWEVIEYVTPQYGQDEPVVLLCLCEMTVNDGTRARFGLVADRHSHVILTEATYLKLKEAC